MSNLNLQDIQIGIIGTGIMGTGIAQVAATCGHKVIMYDSNEAAVQKSAQNLHRLLERLVQKGKMTQSQASGIIDNIQFEGSIMSLKNTTLIIEAIVENLEAKKDVFSVAEDFISPDCILATNTSSLSVTSIASACKNPSRVLGIHFFNPPALMKLVEITPAVQTSASVVDEARKLISGWNKIVVTARDTPGFIVNRVARPFYSEALRILEEGIADVPTIDWAMKEIGRFRMGPFELMDYIGNDVNYAVTESVWQACYFEPRYKPAFMQKRLVEAGYLGRKSGRGYYDYREGAITPEPKTDRENGTLIADRIITMLINEAAEAFYWGVASRDDIDLAMTTGVNYPKGLLQWADERGIRRVVDAMDALYEEYREPRYRCSPLLRSMARMGKSFYEE